jgi:hypothetical protein
MKSHFVSGRFCGNSHRIIRHRVAETPVEVESLPADPHAEQTAPTLSPESDKPRRSEPIDPALLQPYANFEDGLYC